MCCVLFLSHLSGDNQLTVNSALSQAMQSSQTAVNAESSRAIAAETALQSQWSTSSSLPLVLVGGEASRALAQEISLATVLRAGFIAFDSRAVVTASVAVSVLAERTRASTSEFRLQGAVDDESTRALVAEGGLSMSVSLLQGSLAGEVSRAVMVEGLLNGALGAEISRAISSENSLASPLPSFESVSSAVVLMRSFATANNVPISSLLSQANSFGSVDRSMAASMSTASRRAILIENSLSTRLFQFDSTAIDSITATQTAMNDEIFRASSLDNILLQGLDEIRAGVSGAVLSDQFVADVSLRNSIDVELSQGIVDERQRAMISEIAAVQTVVSNQTQGGALGALFANVASSIDIGASRTVTADSILSSKITYEITRSIVFQDNWEFSLVNEVSRASAAEASLAAVASRQVTFTIFSQSSLAFGLRADISRMTRTDSSLAVRLVREESRALSVEASLSRAILRENSRVRFADMISNIVLGDEIVRAPQAEADLGFRIDAVELQLPADLQALQDAIGAVDASLAASLDDERARELLAVTSLRQSIALEYQRANSQEVSLARVLFREVSRAVPVEWSISIALRTTDSRAIASDSSLARALRAEIARASTAENLLSVRRGSEVSRASLVENSIAAKANDLAQQTSYIDSSLASSIADFDQRITVEESNLTSGLIRVGDRVESGFASFASSLQDEASRASNVELSVGFTLAGEASRAESSERVLSSLLSGKLISSPPVDRSLALSILDELQRASQAEASIAALIRVAQVGEQQERSVMRSVDIIEKDIIRLEASLSADFLEELSANESSRAQATEASIAMSVWFEASRAVSLEKSLTLASAQEASRAIRSESSISTSVSAAVWSLQSLNSNEMSRAAAAEALIASTFARDVSRAASLDASIATALTRKTIFAGSAESFLGATLSSAVFMVQAQNLGEASRASAAEASLASLVRLEASAAASRTAAVALSAGVFNQRAFINEASIASALLREVSRATRIEDSIDTGLSNEISRAVFVDASLAVNIVVETSRAVGAEIGLAGSLVGVEGSIARIILIEASTAQSSAEGVIPVIQSSADKASRDVAQEGGRAVAAEMSLALIVARDASNAKKAQADLATSASAATSSWSSAASSLGLALAGEVSRAVFVETVLSVLIANQSINVAILTGTETSRAQDVEASLARSQAAFVAAADVVDGSLAQSIGGVNSIVDLVSTDVSVFFRQETSRAISAETAILVSVQGLNQAVVLQGLSLSTAVANVSLRTLQEVQRATTVERNLSTSIQANSMSISRTSSNLSEFETMSAGTIGNERGRAEVVELSLALSISDTTRATQAVANSTSDVSNNVSQLSLALAQETAARMTQDAALSAAVAAETQRASDVENSLAVVASARDAVVNASLRSVNTRIDGTLFNLSLVENATLSRIVEERDRAVGAETAIWASMQNLNQSVVAQGASLSGAVANVSQRLLLETQRATDTESSLNASIQGNTASILALMGMNLPSLDNTTSTLIAVERSRALDVEQNISVSSDTALTTLLSSTNIVHFGLRNNVSKLASDLLLETTLRTAQDGALASSMSNEVSRAAAAEASLARSLQISRSTVNTGTMVTVARVEVTSTAVFSYGATTNASLTSILNSINTMSAFIAGDLAFERSRAIATESSISTSLASSANTLNRTLAIVASDASTSASLLAADLAVEVSARIAFSLRGSQLVIQEGQRANATEAGIIARLLGSKANATAQLVGLHRRLDADEDFLARRPFASGYWTVRDRVVPDCIACEATPAVMCLQAAPTTPLQQSFYFKVYQLLTASTLFNATNVTLTAPISRLEIRNGDLGCVAIVTYTSLGANTGRRRSTPVALADAVNSTTRSQGLSWTFVNFDPLTSSRATSTTSSSDGDVSTLLIIIVAVNIFVTLIAAIVLIVLWHRHRSVEPSKAPAASRSGTNSSTAGPMGRIVVSPASTFLTAPKTDLGSHAVENASFSPQQGGGGVHWTGLGFLDVSSAPAPAPISDYDEDYEYSTSADATQPRRHEPLLGVAPALASPNDVTLNLPGAAGIDAQKGPEQDYEDTSTLEKLPADFGDASALEQPPAGSVEEFEDASALERPSASFSFGEVEDANAALEQSPSGFPEEEGFEDASALEKPPEQCDYDDVEDERGVGQGGRGTMGPQVAMYGTRVDIGDGHTIDVTRF